MAIDFNALKEPFPENDIEWRVQRAGAKNDQPWAMVLAYVTNRAIMNRLDDIVGPENWRNEFKTGPDGGVLCGIGIYINGEWVTKWDGADKTQVEAVKGGLSGAMKRAAVQWGIGRYLYNLDATFAEISDKGVHYQPADKGNKYPAFKWNPPKLPPWALPNENSHKTPKQSEQPEVPESPGKSEIDSGEPKPVKDMTLDEIKTELRRHRDIDPFGVDQAKSDAKYSEKWPTSKTGLGEILGQYRKDRAKQREAA